jgi:Fe-S-cluster containining protein
MMKLSLFNLFGIKTGTNRERNCLQCGQCCESFGGHLHASPRDLKRWREQGRQDLLDGVNRLGWIWVDPQTKQPLDTCPHLDRSDPLHARCGIHEVKPDMCRAYPTLAHGNRCLRGVFL